MTPRFLIVKYAPDLRKMEPRNIGVIAWRPGCAVMRMMGVTEKKIIVPRFVNTASVYRMWVDSWRKAIEQGSIRTRDDRETISIDDDSFLDTLKATARDNYFLCDGGACIDALSDAELPELTDYLYGELITDTKSRSYAHVFFGIGLPKTGSKSLAVWLEKGFGIPAHHLGGRDDLLAGRISDAR